MAFQFTDKNVNEVIATGQPVVIDFWATYCDPCMAMAPVVDEIAKEYEGRAVVGKYNVDEENDFCSENGVRSLPTILFFKDGKKVSDIRLVGSQKADAIRAKIDELIAR